MKTKIQLFRIGIELLLLKYAGKSYLSACADAEKEADLACFLILLIPVRLPGDIDPL
jgi:hypothetical protein